MLMFLITASVCWGSIFHQVISSNFSYEYFPNITDEQRNSLVLGSIFADGTDKKVTHFIPRIQEKLRMIQDNESNLYWFFIGIYTHIAPDTFAHAGKAKSFIVKRGSKHHLSEFIIDSLYRNMESPSFIEMNDKLEAELNNFGITLSNSFKFIRRFLYHFAKLPFYKFLPVIQKNKCFSNNFNISLFNFQNHYNAMKKALTLSMEKIRDTTFTDLKMKELATNILNDIECCDF